MNLELHKVEERKYEYPYQVNEVPVQTDLFDHFVVTSSFKYSTKGHQPNNDIDNYS